MRRSLVPIDDLPRGSRTSTTNGLHRMRAFGRAAVKEIRRGADGQAARHHADRSQRGTRRTSPRTRDPPLETASAGPGCTVTVRDLSVVQGHGTVVVLLTYKLSDARGLAYRFPKRRSASRCWIDEMLGGPPCPEGQALEMTVTMSVVSRPVRSAVGRRTAKTEPEASDRSSQTRAPSRSAARWQI